MARRHRGVKTMRMPIVVAVVAVERLAEVVPLIAKIRYTKKNSIESGGTYTDVLEVDGLLVNVV